MEIKNRLFPYPVLCADTDDYIETTDFTLESDLKEIAHDLLISYDFNVKCNSLEKLIRAGAAQYVLHLECTVTSFRKALKSGNPHIEYRIPKRSVRGEVNLVAMVVAVKDITSYSSEELNEDYEGESISFSKGAILAYQNLKPIYVSKKQEELANNDSFFTVVKHMSIDPDEIQPMTFNLNSDKIQIIVDSKTYEAFIRYQHSKAIAMAMLVFPALIYMITEVGDDPYRFAEYQWFQSLSKFYSAQGKDFVEDVLQKDDNPVNIAQEMIQNPVSRAYRELYALEGQE